MLKKTLFTLVLFFICLLVSPALADIVYKHDGTVIRGKIIKEDSFYVTIKLKYGVIKIDKEEIDRISRVKTPEEVRMDRLKKCRTADDYYELGRWTEKKARGESDSERKKKLELLALDDYNKALELDPSHDKAHKALGHKYHRGRWWTEDEYREKVLGQVYKNGRWMSRAKARRIEMAEIKRRKEIVAKLWAKRREEIRGISWPKALQQPFKTKNYTVYCNSSQEVGKRYADFMEQLFGKFDQIFGNYRHIYRKQIAKQKSIIMIHRNYDEFLNMHALRAGVGGFYRPAALGSIPSRTVVAFHGSFGDTGNTFNVLAHEGTHQFQHLVMPSILNRPAWIIEGQAVYFGDGHKIDRNGKLHVGVIPRDRLATLQQAIKSNRYIRLRQLIRTPHARFGGFHYAHAWGLIYYMLNGSHPKVNMKRVFQKFFELNVRKAFSRNNAQNTALMARQFERMLGVPLKQFEKRWKKFIMGLELEQVGKVKGSSIYISKKMQFQVSKPHYYSWKFELKKLHAGEKIAVYHRKNTARLGVVAKGNTSLMNSKRLAMNAYRRLPQTLDNFQKIKIRKFYHKGYLAYEFIYRGKPKPTVNSGIIRKTEQKYRMVVFSTLDHVYMIKFQADVDKFDTEKNEEAFRYMLDRFEILQDEE